MSQVRIGVSGWTYAPWRGRFYPKGLPHNRELAHASSVFTSIEINGTFYSMQRPDTFAGWAEATPEDFVFAVKGPRFLTHMKRLNEPVAPLANFIASGVLRLGPKLGPILWQLPPSFRFDRAKLDAFFALLPRDTEAAAACGRRHDHRLKARAWLRPDARRPMRHALEIRHESFRDPAFIELLRKHDIALVCADTVEWPLLMDLTVGLRLLPPAWLARALSQRLQRQPRSRAGPGESGPGATASRCATAPSSAAQPSPGRATSSSISTTPTSSGRRTTPRR